MENELLLATVVSEPFDENTYIAHFAGRKDCVIVDPGFDTEQIVAYLDQRQLTPAALLNTHGHADHIAGNGALKQRWPDCPLVIGRGDAPKLTDARLNLSAGYGMPVTSPAADLLLDDGHTYSAAGFEFDVRAIPGHSSGHVVFIERQLRPMIVFGGDVLFAGSIGRTDFPDGSFLELARGIHRHLFTLPADTVVLSGHGPPTTIDHEIKNNPYLNRAS
ncbi:MAG TPA: MBL fold metallo-hydrolase [Pirellulales bacterium]|nr:MBL fold metallo-hydrolase [Pirellulales bacterium]